MSRPAVLSAALAAVLLPAAALLCWPDRLTRTYARLRGRSVLVARLDVVRRGIR